MNHGKTFYKIILMTALALDGIMSFDGSVLALPTTGYRNGTFLGTSTVIDDMRHLEFLSPTGSINLNWADQVALLDSGGTLEPFQAATTAQVSALFLDYGTSVSVGSAAGNGMLFVDLDMTVDKGFLKLLFGRVADTNSGTSHEAVVAASVFGAPDNEIFSFNDTSIKDSLGLWAVHSSAVPGPSSMVMILVGFGVLLVVRPKQIRTNE